MVFRITPIALLLVCTIAWPTLAQIVPSQNTIVTPQGNTFNITGGNTSGNGKNVFQVFDRLNLTAGQTANFQTQSSIRNILTRITGNEPSRIDGLLKVSGSNANLYLLNPSGILFGPNARLDLSGNFFASNATGIQFGNQIWNGDANTNVNLLYPCQLSYIAITKKPKHS